LIFFMLVGRPPFVAQTADALRDQIRTVGVPALPQMPPWLFAVMARLLSFDASLRPKSAADVARQISAATLAAEAGRVTAGTPVAATRGVVWPTSEGGGPARDAPADAARAGSSTASSADAAAVQASAGGGASARAGSEKLPTAQESVVPFSLDDAPAEDERPHTAVRAGAAVRPGGDTVVPFSLETSPSDGSNGSGEHDQDDRGLSQISADDPDVGVVYDEDDEEEEQVKLGADGKVRRRRRRPFRLPVWRRSALARRMSRLALVPLAGLLIVGLVAGVLFYREWAATRAATERRNAQIAADAARRASLLRPAKPPEPAPLPAGHLAVKTTPSGARVWVDGEPRDKSPVTLVTKPGTHRLVVTLPGYRMLRDTVDTSKGLLWEREMFAAPHLDEGRVPLSVTCLSENKYPIFVDGRDSGELCPASDLRIEPGRHSVGVFVIPQNRIWTFDREVQLNRPHRVQFNY